MPALHPAPLLRRLPAAAASRRTFSSSPRALEHYLDATPAVFATQTSGDRISLVDFYADWCGPCKVLTPVLKKVASPESGVDLITINTDNEQELAAKFSVAAIPTVVAIQNGKVLAKFVGAQPEAAVRKFVESLTQ